MVLSSGDRVQPHTYSSSLIRKSHRLTLGSPRCPERREQKPKEESSQEEEEEEEVSEHQGKKERDEERSVAVVFARSSNAPGYTLSLYALCLTLWPQQAQALDKPNPITIRNMTSQGQVFGHKQTQTLWGNAAF